MNVFASYSDPRESAKYLDDKRVIKMVLESAQLLSTAITVNGGQGPYRVTHKNHPCALWARQTRSNYRWLYNHFLALCDEYSARYGKTHKCLSLKDQLEAGAQLLPDGEMTAFANCTVFKDEPDVHVAYRAYLQQKWKLDKRIPTWYRESR